ncbi:STAS/SEC14 domain-containing protein [Microbulbifer sp. TYP-18]|uniref:STAS/SEC14 domain-containing protein n=1 Tax=Microbulbifer sp. TYP-18 TaxID=3230024 RepID=UPI0034C6A926
MQEANRHGLSIGIQRTNDSVFLYLKATGKLTHRDYEIIVPMIDRALDAVTEPKVKALFDARELEGWELRAAWDDFKLGLKHGNQFSRAAIVGNQHWLRAASAVAGWFVSAEVELFDSPEQAVSWLEKPVSETGADPG